MTYLPTEMIEHILKFSNSSTLHKCLEIPYLAEIVQPILDKRYQHCLKILIKYGFAIDETYAKKQLNSGEIYMWSTNITDTNLTTLTYYCHNLTKIYLEGSVTITDISIKKILHNCPKLKEIYLSYTNITEQTKQLLRNKSIDVY